jgi:anti-repressor protein
MIKVNSNNKVNARDIYIFVDVKTRFNDWISNCINYADLQEGKDFYSKFSKSTGGRRSVDYELTIEAAKEVCIVSATPRAKELRRWLIGLSTQVENLELITVKQAAFAFKVINCLKYIDNQKQAYKDHQSTFIADNSGKLDSKFIYAEFSKYRAKITGWDKAKTDEAITKYLNDHSGYNKSKVLAKDTQTKLSIIDISEAIRVAVLDILFSQHEGEEMAKNFANLCKRMAKEMEVRPEKENKTNLFKEKEDVEHLKSIQMKLV